MKRLLLLLLPLALVACGGGGGGAGRDDEGQTAGDPFEGYAYTVSGGPIPYQYGYRYVVDLRRYDEPVPAGTWRVSGGGDFYRHDGETQSFYSDKPKDIYGGYISLDIRDPQAFGGFKSIKTFFVNFIKGPTYTLRIRRIVDGVAYAGERIPIITESDVPISPEVFTDGDGYVVHTLPLCAKAMLVRVGTDEVATVNGVGYENHTTHQSIPIPVPVGADGETVDVLVDIRRKE